jgi:ABC-2 type transport system ATP-binding protein
MLGIPDIILLDEPTAGLDVEGRVALHEEILNFKKAGKTIILASHDMSEVEELCDRLAILRDGKIAFLGTAHELTQRPQGAQRLHVRFSSPVGMDGFTACSYQCEERGYSVFEVETLRTDFLNYPWRLRSKTSQSAI